MAITRLVAIFKHYTEQEQEDYGTDSSAASVLELIKQISCFSR